jgi:transposase
MLTTSGPIDARAGWLLGHEQFPTTDRGYQAPLAWMREHGQVAAIGFEGFGSFGAALTRTLSRAGERVVEVKRPDRLARRLDGKSDRLRAEEIARGVLGQTRLPTRGSSLGQSRSPRLVQTPGNCSRSAR